MKSHFRINAFFLLILLFIHGKLFASGKRETVDNAPVNTRWMLCITAPDVSGLPVTRQITGDMTARNLASMLQVLSFRLMEEEESAYYRDHAWVTSRATAAKALATKRSERDLLVYRGDRPWKYRKNLKVIDAAIMDLEGELAKIDAVPPVIDKKPLFGLVEANINGTFPDPPAEADEYRFCTNQGADAFIVSSLAEYHGRTYLNIKMYTLYTRSYSFEDSVLFSSDGLSDALAEISGRLALAIAGIYQSGVIVHASPEEAMVVIDGSLGTSGEVRSYSPGLVDIDVRSDNYIPVSVPIELNAGEIAELFIDLTPMGLAAFNINVPGSPGARVFLGSLYAGETPLSLELPKSEYAYISVETSEGEVGSLVYRDNNLVKGSAQFTWTDGRGSADIGTKLPISPEEKRVDQARRGFYRAYGAFWFILPAAILTAGYASTYARLDANNRTVYEPSYWKGVYIGSHITWGTALGVTLFQIFRYLYYSGGDSTPIVKVPKAEAEI